MPNAKLGNYIFNPIEMEDFRTAIKDHKPTVKIGEQNFLFIYKGDLVWFSPQYGTAPCGWLERQRIIDGQDV